MKAFARHFAAAEKENYFCERIIFLNLKKNHVIQNVGLVLQPQERAQVQARQDRRHHFPAQLQVLGHPDDRLVHSCDVTAILR